MNGPTLYERWVNDDRHRATRGLVVRGRGPRGHWIAIHAGDDDTMGGIDTDSFAEAIAYAAAQPAQIVAEPGQGRENGAGVGKETGAAATTSVEGM